MTGKDLQQTGPARRSEPLLSGIAFLIFLVLGLVLSWTMSRKATFSAEANLSREAHALLDALPMRQWHQLVLQHPSEQRASLQHALARWLPQLEGNVQASLRIRLPPSEEASPNWHTVLDTSADPASSAQSPESDPDALTPVWHRISSTQSLLQIDLPIPGLTDAAPEARLRVQRILPRISRPLLLQKVLLFLLLLLTWATLRFGIRGALGPEKERLPIWALACGFLLFTALAVWLVHRYERAHLQTRFEMLAASNIRDFANELQHVRDQEIPALTAFFQYSDEVSSEEFSSFTRVLLEQSRVVSWSWHPRVQLAERPRFRLLTPALSGLWEWNMNHQRISARDRPVSFPIVFTEGGEDAHDWLGFDSASCPVCLAAIEQAIAQRSPISTHSNHARGWDRPGTLVFIPVFHSSVQTGVMGVISAMLPWDLSQIQAFGSRHLDRNGLPLRFSVLEPETGAQTTLLQDTAYTGSSRFHLQKPFLAFGQLYVIEAVSTGAFEGVRAHLLSSFLGVSGCLLSLLLSLFLLRHQRSSLRLRTLVQERTRQIEEASLQFRALSDPLPLGLALIDSQFHVLQTNPRMREWFPELNAHGNPLCHRLFTESGTHTPCRDCPLPKHPVSGGPQSFLKHIDTPIGQRTLRISCRPVPDESGIRQKHLLLAEDVTDTQRMEERSRRQQRFLQLMAQVSALLAQARDDVWDNALQNSVQLLGEFFHADRCCVLRIHENGTVMSNTHEWCAPGVSSQISSLQDVPESALPWWFQQMRSQRVIRFASPADLPPEAALDRAELERQEIQSVLYLTMVDEQKHTIGCLGFDSLRNDLLWTDEDVSMLRLLTDTITGLMLRREGRRQLRANEEQYRLLVDNSINGVVSLELLCSREGTPKDLRFLSVNPAFQELFSSRSADFRYQNASEVLPELLEGEQMQRLSSVVLQGKSVELSVQVPMEEPRFFSVTAYSLGGLRLAAVFNDITLQTRTEKEKGDLFLQLQQSQKLESIGRLAGGVAHDFNNALQIILGNADLSLKFHRPPPAVEKALLEIRDAAKRSSGLTHQLLAFARQQKNNPQVLDLNQVLNNSLRMVRRLLGEHITLESLTEPGLPPVLIDPVQMDQILMNLCVNARDAMGTSGRILIQTRKIDLEKEAAQKHPGAHPGRYAQLSVTDNGHGMPPEVLSNIFDPFYTTKSKGKGTGLGLATVMGIVLQNEGFISVDSKPGTGTTFHIHFPFATPQQIEAENTPPVPAPLPQRPPATGTILIVEDENIILQMATMLVRRLGYTVIPCLSAADALERVRNRDNRPDMLLTDVIMPDMNGPRLADLLRETNPDLKVLFMSGYTEDVLTPQGVFASGAAFIQKPFTLEQLGEKLGSLFAEDADASAPSPAPRSEETPPPHDTNPPA